MAGMQSPPCCSDNGGAGRVYWPAAPNGRVGKSFRQSQEL